MKILFTADIHIKLGQKSVPVDWARNRFLLLWKEFDRLQSNADIFIIGGDVFDKLPNMDELELYFELISYCKIETLIIPGNHEAMKKDTTFLSNLKQVTSKLNPLVRIIDDFETYKGIDFIPYNKLKQYNPADIDFHSDILVSHFRAEIPPHVKPEVNLDMFNRWGVVLAGDLHSYENSQRNILYPGSPITTSFHRNPVNTGVILYDTDTTSHEWVKVEVPQLIRKTVGVNDPKPQTEYHHTVYEVEGDLEELAKLEDNALVDKKISKKSTDSALILGTEMTMIEEVKEYLTYILELPEATIEKAILELQNNMSSIET